MVSDFSEGEIGKISKCIQTKNVKQKAENSQFQSESPPPSLYNCILMSCRPSAGRDFSQRLLNHMTLLLPLRIPLMTSIVINTLNICTGLVWWSMLAKICCHSEKTPSSTQPPSSSFSQQVSGRSAASFNPLTFPADNLEWPNPLSLSLTHKLTSPGSLPAIHMHLAFH